MNQNDTECLEKFITFRDYLSADLKLFRDEILIGKVNLYVDKNSRKDLNTVELFIHEVKLRLLYTLFKILICYLNLYLLFLF